ncbi:hypothetical protein NEOLEDRAFT_683579 [Neolentinus lepideus HHB14362 ss-1]|uniref:Uncharacterized protein n=1 Tax=Neolentinus lepideus HHB14362 ss-1 TaxID=1314782 RepID=A0A165UZK6_9AGAM|nr:hypothetical protein NEOLEDRAFT_683579 [Neolentinus lepideus HHB14362 ss-1]
MRASVALSAWILHIVERLRQRVPWTPPRPRRQTDKYLPKLGYRGQVVQAIFTNLVHMERPPLGSATVASACFYRTRIDIQHHHHHTASSSSIVLMRFSFKGQSPHLRY